MNIDIDKGFTNKDISEALKELIEYKKSIFGKIWSYDYIGKKVGCSRQFISQIINKEVLPPKDEYIEKIAKAFEIEPDYFMEYRIRRISEYLSKDKDYLEECYNKIKPKKKAQKSA